MSSLTAEDLAQQIASAISGDRGLNAPIFPDDLVMTSFWHFHTPCFSFCTGVWCIGLSFFLLLFPLFHFVLSSVISSPSQPTHHSFPSCCHPTSFFFFCSVPLHLYCPTPVFDQLDSLLFTKKYRPTTVRPPKPTTTKNNSQSTGSVPLKIAKKVAMAAITLRLKILPKCWCHSFPNVPSPSAAF